METPKYVTPELRKEVIEKFNLDPLNLEWLIEAISFLYERNNKLKESIEIAHDRIDELQEVQKEYEKLHNSLVDKVYNPEIEFLRKAEKLEEMIMEIKRRNGMLESAKCTKE